jgi:hypothetical protein
MVHASKSRFCDICGAEIQPGETVNDWNGKTACQGCFKRKPLDKITPELPAKIPSQSSAELARGFMFALGACPMIALAIALGMTAFVEIEKAEIRAAIHSSQLSPQDQPARVTMADRDLIAPK